VLLAENEIAAIGTEEVEGGKNTGSGDRDEVLLDVEYGVRTEEVVRGKKTGVENDAMLGVKDGIETDEVVGGKKIGIEGGDKEVFSMLDVEIDCVALEVVNNATLDLLAAIAVDRLIRDGAVALDTALKTVSVDNNDKVEIDTRDEFEMLPEEIPFAIGPLSKGRVRLMSMACVSPVDTPATMDKFFDIAPVFAFLMISEAYGCK